MAIGVVDLVDDLSALFGPETETFNCNAVDQEKIVADEAYGRSFGTVGKASGEVPENRQVSGLPCLYKQLAIMCKDNLT